MALIKANYFCHCLWSLIYFDIEAMIDGEVFAVGLTKQQILLTNKDLLEAFEQLRVKGYSWARFMVTLDEDFLPYFSSMVQPSETTTEADGSDLDYAFRDEGNNCDDLEDYKSGDDSRDELYDDIF
ncbi:hypothetical protein WN943_027643 [Citrus x changshan-huyou]